MRRIELAAEMAQGVAQIGAGTGFGQIAPEQSHQRVARLRSALQSEVREQCASLDGFEVDDPVGASKFTTAE